MAEARDVIIVGGGHNALVAAFYLAQAGLKVLLLERRPVIGGGAITEELYPGFKCSTLAHVSGPLWPRIVSEMRLRKHGLTMTVPPVRVCSLLPAGGALLLYEDAAKSSAQIARFSPRDALAYGRFQQVLGKVAGVLSGILPRTPPQIASPTAGDIFQLLRTGQNLRKLGKKDILRLLRWAPMAVADFVAEWFEGELLRATLASRGIFGNAMGPCSAGTTAVLLMRAALEANPAGPAAFPIGGMGALTEAMARAAQNAGAEIRTECEVAQVRIEHSVANGVVLSKGEELSARAVVSGADPRHTLLFLVDAMHLEPSFVEKMKHYRSLGTVAKVNFALDGLPRLPGVNGADDQGAMFAGRIHIGPQLEYLERAFDHSKYGEFSPEPYLDITIPSLADPSLAPNGKHVMSVFMQYAPFRLRSKNWNDERERLGQVVGKTITQYLRGFSDYIVARQVITPEDLEKIYGFTGGQIFHGELALDQLFTMRPLLGWARYRTPVKGLYLCGSGTHPGLGICGISGANAAREIIKDLH